MLSASASQGLLRWFVAIGATTIVVKVAHAVLIVFLARTLTPSAYALFGLLYAAQTAVASFATVGVVETTVGRLPPSNEGPKEIAVIGEAQALFSATATFTLILVGVLVALRGLASSETIATTAAALTLGAFTAYVSLQANLMRLFEWHRAALYFTGAAPILSMAGLLIGAYWTHSATGTFAGGLIGASVAIAARRVAGVRLPPWGFITPTAIRQTSSLAPFVVMSAFGWLNGYGNAFIIDSLFDHAELARYTLAFTVSGTSQLAATSLNMVWNPRFYKLRRDGFLADAEHGSVWFYRILSLTLGLVGAITVGAVPWITAWLGNNQPFYADLRTEVVFLCGGYIALIPWWHSYNYYLVSRQGSGLLRVAILSSLLGLAVSVSCMMLLGTRGIYVGFVIQALARSALISGSARQHWELKTPWATVLVCTALPATGLFVPTPV